MKMSDYPAKYEVLIKQYLRSILDIIKRWKERLQMKECETRLRSSRRNLVFRVSWFRRIIYL